MPDEVKKITIETARPRLGFPGRVETGHYVVTEGFVVLTDEQGRPISDKVRVGNGDARGIACAMLRGQKLRRSLMDFAAPISYQRSKYL